MELLLEAVGALGLLAALLVVLIAAPLVFMVIFSLVTGFDDRVDQLEQPSGDE